MKIISPVAGIRGRVVPPGDKSISHRAAIIGSLSDEGIEVTNFSPGEDCASTLRCLKQLGCTVERRGGSVRVARGRGLTAPGGVLDAGNSGTTARLLCGLLSGVPGMYAVLTGDDSLRRRPMARVVRPLQSAGARIDGRDGGALLPLTIRGNRLAGGSFCLPVASAQVKTSLLLAGLQAQGSTAVEEPRSTRNHTEIMLSHLGVPLQIEGESITVYPCSDLPGGSWRIPGDFSAASFWIVAAAITSGSELSIEGVGMNPTRTGLMSVLQRMGLSLDVSRRGKSGGEPVADLLVRSSRLMGTEVSADEIPILIDELPVLAVAAAVAEGTTTVRGAGELRVKECDRIAAVAHNLRVLGVDIEELEDGWTIRGGHPLSGGDVKSFGDHRIAMSMAVAGLVSKGDVRIDDADPVAISDPRFFDVLDEVSVGRKA